MTLAILPSRNATTSLPSIGGSAPAGPSGPGEANVIAVAVRRADDGEAKAREASVDGADQAVDLGRAAAAHQRVDIARVVGPAFGKAAPAALGVGLVPGVEVAGGDGERI